MTRCSFRLCWWIAAPAAVSLMVMAVPGCGRGEPAQRRGPGPAPVSVATAERRDVSLSVEAIGAVSTPAAVTIRSQVDGQVEAVHFTRGQEVKKGQALFTIDARSYRAALGQAQGDLSRDQALAANAKVDATRTAELAKQAAATEYEAQQARRKYESLEATVRADRAAVAQARLKVGYCSIASPMTGRAGDLMVNVGDVVKVNDTAMVVINQIKPIYVTFAVPEQYLDPLRKLMGVRPLTVAASIPAAPSAAIARLLPPPQAEHGKVTFVNNQVDTSTGLVALKATFANRDEQLWPGQYVNTKLSLLTLPGVVVVPSEAVQTGQHGEFVYLVKADKTVAMTPITAGIEQDGRTVIVKGVSVGQTVVTDGQLRLRDGSKVTIKPAVGGAGTEPSP